MCSCDAATRAKEIRKYKDLTKNLDNKLQGEDDCATQQRIDEGLLGKKKKTSRSLVDEKFADWIYNTTQSFNVVGPDLSELVNYITKYAPSDYVRATNGEADPRRASRRRVRKDPGDRQCFVR
jgi:hypothetical protein